MVRISGYEWELLEDGFFLGRTPAQWYQIFLAEGDSYNLAKIKEFYNPPSETIFKGEYNRKIDAPQILTSKSILTRCIENQDLILSLHWREFEFFTKEMLQELGYLNVKIGQGSKDEGVDVTAFIEHALGIEKIIVQCKRYSPIHKIGKPIIKQLLWETDAQNAAKGMIVTTSTLTRPAKFLVESHRHKVGAIEINDIKRILREI